MAPIQIFKSLLEFRAEIYRVASEKGFWPEDRSKGEAVALILTELSEAIEAHRKPDNIKQDMTFSLSEGFADWCKRSKGTVSEYTEYWNGIFSRNVKDTVADELADTVIRLLDVTYGFHFPLDYRVYTKETTGNFAHDILRIEWYVMLAFEGREFENTTKEMLWKDLHRNKTWGYALSALISFCQWNNIDIIEHVRWKIKYNSSRPHKHGGKKY